jgi:hypothetical protein
VGAPACRPAGCWVRKGSGPRLALLP